MRLWIGGAAAALLLVIGWTPPAAAQVVPRGSYLGSCWSVGMRGQDTLIATCRTRSGRSVRTVLRDVDRCAGDIGNANGRLHCQHRNGRQAWGEVIGQPGPNRYGPPPYGGPPGRPPYNGGERHEHCERLRHRYHEVRERLERTYDRYERRQLEHRLHEIRERLRRCWHRDRD